MVSASPPASLHSSWHSAPFSAPGTVFFPISMILGTQPSQSEVLHLLSLELLLQKLRAWQNLCVILPAFTIWEIDSVAIVLLKS